ncbi:MAG: glycosyltransferase [Candidatus Omnitrophica bacterium]|nr:glycosyltransferase [Candidatus Omnitrophota bacterium]
MRLLIVHNFYKDPTGEDLTVQERARAFLNNKQINLSEYYAYSKDFGCLSLGNKIKKLIKANCPFCVPSDFKNLLDREKPDVVELHNTIPLINIWILKELKKRAIPVTYFIHNYRFFCPRGTAFLNGKTCFKCFHQGPAWCVLHNCLGNIFYSVLYAYRHFLCGLLLKNLYLLISPSKYIFNLYRDKLPGSRICSLPFYIEIPENAKMQKSAQKDFILFAGRLVKEKGVCDVLAAANILKDISFVLCADGPLYNYCKSTIARDHLHNVMLLGWVAREDLLFLLKGAACLVFPSMWDEVSPRIILESLSLGTPVITSSQGSLNEFTGDCFNYEKNNIQDLVSAIKEVFIRRSGVVPSEIPAVFDSGDYVKRLLTEYEALRANEPNP